ncbi:hypothetical protein BUPH_04809 (plasmid) [Paraburkholderia phenoliruptrix BR3459a]|uniref:Uncharacterized protein n=1 Tax=Paraburkholderia phenoliruptrix BR3459a TaxID=1229205 RepID=K0E003_9BURK|nr:hypothetical protein BUPH_04809 [Paraburkholderia phenoliruptrix BR3459a]
MTSGMGKLKTARKALPPGSARFSSDCTLERMMAERGIEVDHSSPHRWVIKLVPLCVTRSPRAATSGTQLIKTVRPKQLPWTSARESGGTRSH